MFSRFFIDRPIFAAVLSVLIILAGGISYFALPLAQFPSVMPPTIQVDCIYPGANAQVVAEAVATPIEQQINGVERMLYMASQCNNDGSYSLSITFENGMDLNMAQVMVQNRISLAMPLLPDVVKQTGVGTRMRSPDILLAINIFSPDSSRDITYISSYTTIRIKDEIARVDGIGDMFLFGQRDYSMRVWIDPEKLAARSLTAGDVAKALREQNAPVPTGQIGMPPTRGDQQVQYTLTTLGRLKSPAEFDKIIIKAMPDGRMVRLKDVARVQLDARNYDTTAKIDNRESIGLVVFQLPNANALKTVERVIHKMDELKKDFPPGLDYQLSYETTSYTEESISEVYKALFHAVLLVAAVVLLFLQNWRAALIPLAAVPVAVIGTAAVALVLGFSLNTLTLFGVVLAIGIVVDDAIVVVEAVEHHLENGLLPREASLRAMEQVAGPVVAVALVLSAVFVPCAFVGGLTGQFFRQFALTIASSTILSAFNSLTLSPALTALLLKPRKKGSGSFSGSEKKPDPFFQEEDPLPRPAFAVIFGWLGWLFLAPVLTAACGLLPWDAAPVWLPKSAAVGMGAILGWFLGPPLNRMVAVGFRAFHRGFRAAVVGYTLLIGHLLRISVVVLLIYAALVGLTLWGLGKLPRGFIPPQDTGYLLMGLQLPDAASDERTRAVMDQAQSIILDPVKSPGIRHCTGICGVSFVLGANSANFATMFVLLETFDKRTTPDLTSDAIIARLRRRFEEEITDGTVLVFPAPPMRGVGRAGGFRFMVEDRGDVGIEALQKATDSLIERGNKDPRLANLTTASRINVPQLYVDVDRKECMALDVAAQDVFDTLRIFQGSLYVNDINLFGRTWQVIAQAEPRFRRDEHNVGRLQVRNQHGAMVQLATIAKVKQIEGPLNLNRYNTYPAVPINGSAAPGISSGEGNDAMRELARSLPNHMYGEWTEMAFFEEQAGNTAIFIFGAAVVMVFLVLAAQYESWSLPLAVILVVPMCLLSASAGVWIARQDVNIFTQIGFVVLVGLASKNAILIVEYAKRQLAVGKSPYEATLEACKLRLRPIIMTSFAFILGVLPLVLGTGAGSEMRRALGTAVFAGMLGVTLFGIFLTPVFFYVIDRMSEARVFRSPELSVINRHVLSAMWITLVAATLGTVYLFTRRGNGAARHKR